jgi:hydrogenase 3 maturation protease
MMKTVIIGLGNEYRGDDAIGLECVIHLSNLHPEALTDLRKDNIYLIFYSELTHQIDEVVLELLDKEDTFRVIFIDAVNLEMEPGTYTWITDLEILNRVITTHQIPLRMYFELLNKKSIQCHLLAIQPKQLSFEKKLSNEMHNFLNKHLLEAFQFLGQNTL